MLVVDVGLIHTRFHKIFSIEELVKKLRISDYIISVDLNNSNDDVLLIHGYIGSFIKLSRQDACKLKEFECIPNLDLTREQVLDLKRGGFLTDFSKEEEYEYLKKTSNNLHLRNSSINKSYHVIMTYDCNFNCSYCFQTKIREGMGPELTGKVVDGEMIDQIIHAMNYIDENLYNGASGETRKVTLFGGEPLMRKNFGAVERFIDKAQANCETQFIAVTNGYELVHFKPVLDPNRLSQLQISLDGCDEISNRRRTKENVEVNIFDKLVDNITMALELGVGVDLRINTDKNNIDQLDDFKELIINNKWDQFKNFQAVIAPVFVPHYEEASADCYNLGNLLKEVTAHRCSSPDSKTMKIAEESMLFFLSNSFNSNKPVSSLFRTGYCSAISHMLLFDPMGNIHKCFERLGLEKYSVGRVDDIENLSSNPKYRMWEDRVVTTNETCLKCSYSLFCGGGCASRAKRLHGTYYSNYCDGFQSFFKQCVARAYNEKDKYMKPDLTNIDVKELVSVTV